MERLNKQLTSYYKQSENAQPRNIHDLKINEYVITCKSDSYWQRAVIRGIDVANDQIDVDYVDYGDMDTCKSRDIYDIARQFREEPCQAILVKLDGVRAKGNEYQEEMPSIGESIQSW